MSLPSLTALRAFLALAETGTAVAAGRSLNVSHAAISQQIRALEAHMGVALVDRTGRTLLLTADGQELAEALRLEFGTIAKAVDALTGADAERPVQVSTTQLFASTWLMPRLLDFQTRNPDIDLMIHPSATLTDPQAGGVDVALRFGDGVWPGLEVEMLVPSDIVITAAPSLVRGRSIDSPADLLAFPWLEELGTSSSRDWLQKHGVTEGRVKQWTHVPGNLMLDGARAGQGVICTAMSSVEDDVEAGRLCLLFRDSGETGYHIVTRPGVMRPKAKIFVTWLRRQRRADRPLAANTGRNSAPPGPQEIT
ncbi:MAG: LysR family transcriptional regulator [Pseudomonadota bacterium]